MTPYEILGVPVTATPEQIKAAHKRLAHTWHPDKCHDAGVKPSWEAKFREIQEAYEVLSDKARRQAFDATGETAVTRDEKEAADVLRDAIQRAAAEWLNAVNNGLWPVTRGLLPEVRSVLINARAEQRSVKRQAALSAKHVAALRARPRSKRPSSVVSEMTQFFADNIERDIARMDRKLVLLDMAMAMLDECSEDDIQAGGPAKLSRPSKLLGGLFDGA